ncbi:S8 family serine peptidase [Bacillus salitolerans]|uniref:S8 family serine peptidase n=1 Tax=Bacillus salitolerans TaxID=1437434 RepID=A0ABW4LPW0_9BACI
MKRGFALLLAFIMVFSNFSAVAAATSSDNVSNYSSSDKVRVIVELDSDPGIIYAQKEQMRFTDLSASKQADLIGKALNEQAFVKKDIAKHNIDITYEQSFTTVFNGFSGEVEYGNIAKIERLANVKKVYLATEYTRPEVNLSSVKPDMIYSKNMVKAQETWADFDFKGEGMVVAVLDTGIDPNHQDMVLSEGTQPSLTKEVVDTVISQKGLKGKYFTEKVPFGYNYMDKNNIVLDLGPDASMHGMHVSGTVAANGDEENGGIMGVAPEAQILAMKVFGNDPMMPSTYSDIYIKAIDDAIALGADVINMSLGSPAAFVDGESPDQQAVARAVDNGVYVSISAGNSSQFGSGFDVNPFSSNPDIGMVGSPSVSYDSTSVANMQNDYIDLDGFIYENGDETVSVPFISSSSIHPNDLSTKTYEVVYAGLGRLPGNSAASPDADDFAGVDVKGKIALIQRGESTFVSKTLNAQANGAVGVIVFNNVAGYVSMASDPAITIPQLFVLKEDGDGIKAQLDAGEKVSITFNGEKVTAVNPDAGALAESSSWGLTPNLDFKPELTAPGNNILSTLNDNKYGLMSGTSMAAPHVSGGAALVLHRVDEELGLSGKDRVVMAKNILMNTSTTVADMGTYNANYGVGNPYSPRRQGAGLMNLYGAMSTPVVVTEANSNEAKVALKEVDDVITFSLKAHNFGSEEVTYRVEGNVQTDLVFSGVNQLEAQGIFKNGTIGEDAPWVGDFPISFSSETLTIPANGSKTFEVTVDLTDVIDWGNNLPLDEVFENGYFVEGFVKLVDINDTLPALTVPYVGFHGDWDDAPVLDGFLSDENSYYGESGLVSSNIQYEEVNGEITPVYEYLGYNPVEGLYNGSLAISPNGDGQLDAAIPLLSFLRNAKNVEFSILDENKKVLRKLNTETDISKNYFASETTTLFDRAAWDGKIKNSVTKDGLYYLQIKTLLDYPGAEWQVSEYPVYVDTKSPGLRATLKEETGVLDLFTVDSGSGVSHLDIQVNGKSVLDAPLSKDTTRYYLKDVSEDAAIKVISYDYAGNARVVVVSGDAQIPFVVAETPAALEPVNTRTVPVSGYVTDASDVDAITVNGKSVKLAWDQANNHYTFNTTVQYEVDGMHDIVISGVDSEGNEITYTRSIFVDATAPKVTVDAPLFVDANTETASYTVAVEDNFGELYFYIDGNEEFKQLLDQPLEMKTLQHSVTKEVTLESGKNTFLVEVEDIAGNKTVREVNIYRGMDAADNYKDVSASHWASEEISFLSRLGVVDGYDNGSFGANDHVKRSDAIEWIVNALGLDTENRPDPGFSDVSASHPAYKAIAAAKAEGIISGSNGKFMPDNSLSRAQMAKILSVAFDLQAGYDAKFSDVPTSHWAAAYINSLAAENVTTGKGDGSYAPNESTNRAQLAVFLARVLEDSFK